MIYLHIVECFKVVYFNISNSFIYERNMNNFHLPVWFQITYFYNNNNKLWYVPVV